MRYLEQNRNKSVVSNYKKQATRIPERRKMPINITLKTPVTENRGIGHEMSSYDTLPTPQNETSSLNLESPRL